MNTALKYLFTDYTSKKEAKLFRQLLYAFMLVKCLYWLTDFDLLFSANGIVFKNEVDLSLIKSTAFILFNSGSDAISCWFLISALVISATGLFTNYFSRITAFIIWFLLINIDNKIYPTLTGGDFLFQQLLFFNIFLSGLGKKKSEVLTGADKACHNAGVMAIKIQICLVYFMSGLAKLMDHDWQTGEALLQTFLVHDFSLPFYYNNAGGSSVILKVMNYIIITYQMAFLFLIWIKKTEKFFLGFGVLQHLFIALAMGLPSFGFIMIISYSIFYAPVFRSEKIV